MLAYFDTSGHDVQTLRETYGRQPAPEFLEWAIGKEIFVQGADGQIERGPKWGDPRQFCESDAEFQELCAATPAVPGFESAGPRPADRVERAMRVNQAIGREAIRAELRIDELERIVPLRTIETTADSREAHLNSPELGARLAESSAKRFTPEPHAVQILISDGLSAEAVHHNLPDLLPVLLDGLRGHGISFGQPLVARYGRVKLAEAVAEQLQAEVVIHLIGERPGGDELSSRSLSAYLVYRLCDPQAQAAAAKFSGNPAIRFEYTVVSNIYDGGLPPAEAASVLVERVAEILKLKAAGNRLESLARQGGR
jgi:ethanolamine ammonia-lyase large subunit